jgi:hypothetical protein
MRGATIEDDGRDAERGNAGEERPAVEGAAVQALDGELDAIPCESVHRDLPVYSRFLSKIHASPD